MSIEDLKYDKYEDTRWYSTEPYGLRIRRERREWKVKIQEKMTRKYLGKKGSNKFNKKDIFEGNLLKHKEKGYYRDFLLRKNRLQKRKRKMKMGIQEGYGRIPKKVLLEFSVLNVLITESLRVKELIAKKQGDTTYNYLFFASKYAVECKEGKYVLIMEDILKK